MPDPTPIELTFAPDALERALHGDGDDLDFDSEILEHEELRSVARRIAGSHVEVVARFARTVFAGDTARADLQQFSSALVQLERLADAARDEPQRVLLHEMHAFVGQQLATSDGRRGRNRLLARVQRFVDTFAGSLEGDDAERLARLVRYDTRTAPLLAELATLRGIGPRRLERLYCCGLYTAEAVAHADPLELAAVSGLPAALSRQVIDASRAWAVSRRARSVEELRAAVDEFVAMSAALRERVPAAVLAEARAGLADLTAALAAFR